MQSEHQRIEAQGGKTLTVAVVGAGAFGTALAVVLSGAGHQTRLWTRREEVADSINRHHRHPGRLQELDLPPQLQATTDLHAALADAQLVVSALPMTALRCVWTQVAPSLMPGSVIVSATKGIETETLLLPTAVIRQSLTPCGHCVPLLSTSQVRSEQFELSKPMASKSTQGVVCLSGPSFALELAQGLPTAVTVAADTMETARFVQRSMSTNRLRCYACTDVVGTQLAGALKNVIAIASGVAAGLQLGHNTQAALVSRGLAEIMRLGTHLGAAPMTFMGLGGVGDLMLTCAGGLSRNRQLGLRLAQGQTLKDILQELGQVAEGVNTAACIQQLSRQYGVQMPICMGVCRMLFAGAKPRAVLEKLMCRELKTE